MRERVDLLTVAEVAALWRVSTSAVTRWIRADMFPERPGGGPAVIRTPSGQLRIHADAVRAWISKPE